MLNARFNGCKVFCLVALIVFAAVSCNAQKGIGQSAIGDRKPNILLVVVDDLGFSDLGVLGGEIATPNIDTLAKTGTLLTNFHVAPTCSPTRAMLLSGVDNHIAGLGNMYEALADNQKGQPGYEGYLNFQVAALPEVLYDAGYHTYMTGKWHLGLTEETAPSARGFEKSFSPLQGGAGHFSNMLQLAGPNKALYRENGQIIESLPEDFYSTKFYAEKMIEYIDTNLGDGKPFFSYLAFTAPHWPLQAPDASIEKYRGRYDDGYEALVQKRLKRLKNLGLMAQDIKPYPQLAGEKPWESLSEEEQRYEAKRMEIYAAMVDDIDVYLGKVIDFLKEKGEYDNTVIVFMSDNGPEGHNLEEGWEALVEHVASCCNNSYENIGKPDSYIWQGPNWAQAGSVAKRMFKGFTSQGGINAPAIVSFPKAIKSGVITDTFTHVTDVMPTVLEVANVDVPGATFRGREISRISGKSMLPMLQGVSREVYPADHIAGWELFGKRAIRQGDWKLLWEPVPYGTGGWQLYNLEEDPAEVNDLALQNPDRFEQMKEYWEAYAKANNVIIPNSTSGY